MTVGFSIQNHPAAGYCQKIHLYQCIRPSWAGCQPFQQDPCGFHSPFEIDPVWCGLGCPFHCLFEAFRRQLILVHNRSDPERLETMSASALLGFTPFREGDEDGTATGAQYIADGIVACLRDGKPRIGEQAREVRAECL